jgi:hypothetical protein
MYIPTDIREKKERRADARAPEALWHAVGIEVHNVNCTPALQCRGKRFLSREAPSLPMPTCSHPHLCRCTYRHFADRRIKARRSNETGGLPRAAKFVHDQRSGRGRRQTDQ